MNDIFNGQQAAINGLLVTIVFLAIMLVMLIVAVRMRIKNPNSDFVEHAPGLITSLGILGTFTGIILGLSGFDINEIDASITTLMAGVKIAFVTSIFGIALSILFRAFDSLYPNKEQTKRQQIGVYDLYQASREQNERIGQLSAILVSSYEKQHKQFERSVDRITSEIGSALIDKLNDIVLDFNDSLETQFGGNLSALAGSLENFFQQTEDIENLLKEVSSSSLAQTQQLNTAASILTQATNAVANIPSYLNDLGPLLKSGTEQIEQLNEGFSRYTDLTEKMQHLMPKMSINAEEFSNGMSSIQKLLTEDIQDLLEGYKQVLSDAQLKTLEPVERWQEQLYHSMAHFDQQLNASLGGLSASSNNLNQQVQILSDALVELASVDKNRMNQLVEQSAQSHRESMMDLAEHQARTHLEMTEALSEMIDKHAQRSDYILERQVGMINKHLDREVEKVMHSMGEALATIGGQFTRDYELLISQMKRAMESAGELH